MSTSRPLPFVLAASSHGTLIVNRNDYRMTDPTHGYGVGHQIFQTSAFDPQEVGMALHLLTMRREFFGDGVVAIDGGANIGVHTLEWAKHMHGWGRVIGVEAQERVFYALAGNVAINNCFNATVRHAALGATEGSLGIPRPNYLEPASFGSLELRQRPGNEFIGQAIDYTPGQGDTVRMITVDGLNLPRLDFLKLDIEGMELEALQGALQSIVRHKPQMLIEVIKTDAAAVRQLLDQHSYQYFQVGINLIAIHSTDPSLARIKVG
ncbi:MAG: FkbM family methyltransferase [Haliea sp.]|nr:MAG: FkbM family methyltransferase [Haliea sp.]